MASGRINLQANDGKVAGIVFEDGASGNVAVTVPKDGGKLAADSLVVHKTGDETIAGVKTFSNNTVFNSNVGIGTSSPSYRIDALGHIKSGGVGQDGGYVFARSSDNVIASSITLNSSTQILEYKNALGLGIHSFNVNNVERFRIDSSGNVLVTASGGLGYGTGSGGTVTQLTSKSTAVTLNKPCGRITMNNASLASGATTVFQVNNSLVTTNDTVYVNAIDNDHYDVTTGWTSNSAFVIRVKNTTAGALAEALQIQFNVTKGATS